MVDEWIGKKPLRITKWLMSVSNRRSGRKKIKSPPAQPLTLQQVGGDLDVRTAQSTSNPPTSLALVTFRGVLFDSVHPWCLAWLEAPNLRIRLARIQAGLMSKLGSLSETRTFRLARNTTGYCLTRCTVGTSLGSRHHPSGFAWLEF